MRLFLLAALLATGCAPRFARFPGPLAPMAHPVRPLVERIVEPEKPPPTPVVPAPRAPDPLGASIAAAALYYLDHAPPSSFRNDCSGFVGAVLARAGAPTDGSTRSYWELAQSLGLVHHRRTPRLGDLVFFDDTYDRNGNRRMDDELTHIAIVVAVEPDGTIVMAHGGTSRGRATSTMNLQHPNDQQDENGKEINSPLRRLGYGSEDRHLTGQLVRGFATLRERDRAAWMGL